MSIGRSARRVLIVCTTATVCGAWVAGPAAAASTDSTDLLGLGGLVSSLTQPQPAAAAPHSASTSNSSLVDTLESLPILGPVLKPVVNSVPLLGSGTNSTPSTPAAPVPAGNIANRIPTTQLPATGSTWTMSHVADPAPAAQVQKPPADAGDGSSGGLFHLPSLPVVAGKTELGVAALALIILGGVAVAGAAGAAGAAGRRQFVGGPW
jgi:hypothetical protein